MGKPYSGELWQIPDTISWALSQQLGEVDHLIRSVGQRPLTVVGSGGSYAGAALLARLHEEIAGCPAKVVTPLDYVLSPQLNSSPVILLSASGRNKDILKAFDEAIHRNSPFVGSVIASLNSPLAKRTSNHSTTGIVEFSLPSGKDGFLATNSLMATSVLLTRSYMQVLGMPFDGSRLLGLAHHLFRAHEHRHHFEQVLSRSTISVLTGGWGWPAGLDLESKFVEAALVNVQLTDLRNFGHGRHHWLAKRGDSTSVVFLVEPNTRSLAYKTQALIPKDVPSVMIETSGAAGPLSALELLMHSLSIVQRAGEMAGYDPGRPGVPEFGRKLYHLSVSTRPKRKAAFDPDLALARKWPNIGIWDNDQQKAVETQLQNFMRRLQETTLLGVVLDYDGTLCSPNRRFDDLTPVVAGCLTRLVHDGLIIGIATGRGQSALSALRKALPSELWARVVVGAYNGGEVALLSEGLGDQTTGITSVLQGAYECLLSSPGLASAHLINLRRNQITLEPRGIGSIDDIVAWVSDVLAQDDRLSSVGVRRSGHSVDIVVPSSTKLRVVEHVQELAKRSDAASVLTIGDQGQFGGNDYELLSLPLALSVDLVSKNPNTCWNLSPRGVTGLEACIGYLMAIRTTTHSSLFDLDALKNWWGTPYE